jgi:hypothetical protein
MAMGGRVRNLQPFQISPDRVEWLAKAEILVANFDEHRPNFEDLSGFNERIHEFASIRNYSWLQACFALLISTRLRNGATLSY